MADGTSYAWAVSYIARASEAGYVSGYEVPGGYEFRPRNHVTRAEVATILYRCTVADPTPSLDAGKFPDNTEAFESTEDWRDLGVLNVAWAEPYFVWTCDTGILSGSAGPTGLELKPNDYADRAQMAKIIVVAAETVGA